MLYYYLLDLSALIVRLKKILLNCLEMAKTEHYVITLYLKKILNTCYMQLLNLLTVPTL